ncbi:MAG: membrane-bound ClpP family serine protease [Roseivirga sp.]|jgi:membrane-bound ClpP family serine protease
MSEWITIILLILIGLALVYAELIFIPGTTIIGVVGFLLTAVGIYVTYDTHGSAAGNYALSGSVLVSIIALVYSFRAKTWDRLSLKGTNLSKVNEGYLIDLKIDQEGIALSDLKPIGKAEFQNKTYEVTSSGQHVSAGSKLKISHLVGNKIIVKSLTT